MALTNELTYAEAKKVALGLSKRVNACNEYEKAYHFFEETSDDIDGDAGVVIMKETGRAVSFVQFILNSHPERNPKRIKEF